jgi:hypothetical protein
MSRMPSSRAIAAASDPYVARSVRAVAQVGGGDPVQDGINVTSELGVAILQGGHRLTEFTSQPHCRVITRPAIQAPSQLDCDRSQSRSPNRLGERGDLGSNGVLDGAHGRHSAASHDPAPICTGISWGLRDCRALERTERGPEPSRGRSVRNPSRRAGSGPWPIIATEAVDTVSAR